MEIIKDLNNLSDNLTLIDVFATWCGPCKMLAPVIEEFSENNKDVLVYKVDADQSLDLCRKYNIQSIPTLLLFKNKELIARTGGYMDIDELEEWVKENK